MFERASLIIDEHPLQTLPSLAAVIGLNESIFLQQLHYWLQQKPHLRDGDFWIYNTISEWRLQFPFWSERTIRRTAKSLKDLGLIKTTDQYNPCRTDRRLWYAIDYENLQKIGIENIVDFTGGQDDQLDLDNDLDNVDASTGQDDRLTQMDNVADSSGRADGQDDRLSQDNVDASIGQDDRFAQMDDVADSSGRADGQHDRLDLDNVDTSIGQDDRLCQVNMDASNGQTDRSQSATLSGSLYGTETTAETTTETTAEITTTTTAIQDPSADSANPQPEDVVVVLSHHGISESVARRFAQKYPQEYLLEKIEFLEFEQTRMTNLANPAGWLRRAIEDDYARPSGFQSASEIEAQQVAHAQREAALLETQRAERQARVEAEQARAKAEEAAEADKIASQLASIDPTYGTTEALLQAWEEGVRYVAKSSLGGVRMLMDGLRETVLLAFEAGHAKIGIWDDPANYAFRQRGKQFLKECLAYAMRDTLGGRSGTYELVLLGAQ